MPRPSFHVLVLLALWLLAACRTVPNPDYCTVDGDCRTPERPDWTCHPTQNFCEEPTVGIPCQTSGTCNSDAPICDPEEQICRGCSSGSECAGKNRDTPVCNMQKQCVAGCMTAEDCPDRTEPICNGMTGLCEGCGGDDTLCDALGAGTPYCDDDGSCAGCLNDGQCTATPMTPVCDMMSSSCRGCLEHDECDSKVCNRGSDCVADTAVIYVTMDGTGTDCTQEAPCGSIADALAQVVKDTREVIRLDGGTYTGQIAVSNTKVRIIGDGAIIELDDTTPDIPVIDIGISADVTLEGLTITGANGGTNAHGISCFSNDMSKIHVSRSSIRDNAQVGMNSTGCGVTVARSAVTRNAGGGIRVRDAAFDITNSYILNNGDVQGSALGGVTIVNTVTASPQRFAFNTVARNEAGALADAGGVHCDILAAPAAVFTSNIILQGFGGKPSVSGDCIWRHSNIQSKDTLGAIAADSTNIDADCLSTRPDDLDSIAEGSDCVAAGQDGTGIVEDYDGDERPATTPDMGADEIKDEPAPASRAE
jgi:hypothetical protein